MPYELSYWCSSNIGKIRSVNQDNFACNGCLMAGGGYGLAEPIGGTKAVKSPCLFGVFDGMGGEECGEVASYIAARDAAVWEGGKNALQDLSRLCRQINSDICAYADANGIGSMGTTAAMLVFTKKNILLCNIGDSKIFRLHEGEMRQISTDHVSVAVPGAKPPLSQNLGIPPTEMIIEPYLAQGAYHKGDVYLLCSDGLTDMVTTDRIAALLSSLPLAAAGDALMQAALAQGGKDNITVLLCRVQRRSGWFARRKPL